MKTRLDSKKKSKPKMHEIIFSNNEVIRVAEMNGTIFGLLQELHKSCIVKIDGVSPAFWGMTKEEIQAELKRIKQVKKIKFKTKSKHENTKRIKTVH